MVASLPCEVISAISREWTSHAPAFKGQLSAEDALNSGFGKDFDMDPYGEYEDESDNYSCVLVQHTSGSIREIAVEIIKERNA